MTNHAFEVIVKRFPCVVINTYLLSAIIVELVNKMFFEEFDSPSLIATFRTFEFHSASNKNRAVRTGTAP
jgi:hypothetical protein